MARTGRWRITRGPGYYGPEQVRVWHDTWIVRKVPRTERTYVPSWPEHGDLAEKPAGGGDFWTNFLFAEAIRTSEQPYLDVYRGVAMSSVGILGWKSALANGAPFEVPDFRSETTRSAYETIMVSLAAICRPWAAASVHLRPHSSEAEAVARSQRLWAETGAHTLASEWRRRAARLRRSCRSDCGGTSAFESKVMFSVEPEGNGRGGDFYGLRIGKPRRAGITRRTCLAQAGAVVGSTLLPVPSLRASADPIRNTCSGDLSAFTYRSHAHVILENFLKPYLFCGKLIEPQMEIVSLWGDQFPEGDMSEGKGHPVAKRFSEEALGKGRSSEKPSTHGTPFPHWHTPCE